MITREIPRRMIEATISADADDRRFEHFVADLFSARDGIAYETTAPTGDTGIDARGPVTLAAGISCVCATTQSGRFREKGEADVERVVAKSMSIARLHLCFSKSVKEQILTQLRRFGAAIWLTQPVLEEATHHAEIADTSFHSWCDRVQEAHQRAPTVDPVELLDPADNAFVKGFAITAGRRFKRRDWGMYIRQFRGPGKRSSLEPLRRLLEAELRASYRCEDTTIVRGAKALAERLTDRISRNEGGSTTHRTLRIEWDARLLANCVDGRGAEPLSHRMIILSESEALRTMLRRFVAPERRMNLTISDPSAIAFALAAAPGTSVNLDSVRQFLFGGLIKLSESFANEHLIGNTFNDSARLLRAPSLAARLDDLLTGALDPSEHD